MPVNINWIDKSVRFGRDDKHVLFGVVTPEITQGPGHSQEGDLVDVCGAADGSLVPHAGSVPHYTWHTTFGHDLSTTLDDSFRLFVGFWLVIARQRVTGPVLHVVRVLLAEHDGGVADVTHVDLAATDKGNAGRRAGSTGQAGGGFGPFFCKMKITVNKLSKNYFFLNDADKSHLMLSGLSHVL